MSVLKQTSPRASVAVGGVFDLSDLRGEAAPHPHGAPRSET
jgi:hypothetical protein